jgi:tryptophanyl-tRNA synthetase
MKERLPDDTIGSLMVRAMETEREACAAVADAHALAMRGHTEEENAAQQIACAIRFRGPT